MAGLDEIKAKAIAAAKATKVPETIPDKPGANEVELGSQEAAVADPEATKTPVQITPKVEKLFQCYKSTIDNQKIAMPNGKLIKITGGQYITDNEEEITFLDTEIKAGFPFLKKNGSMTSSDLDPMSALRKKIIAEALASGELIPNPELGGTETQKLNPAGTVELAALSAGSISAPG